MMNSRFATYFLRSAFVAALIGLLFALSTNANADDAVDADALRQKIIENNKKIQDLQKQISQYSTLLNSTSKQAQTLKSALSELELTQKKLEANLSLTTTQISKTSLTLHGIQSDISTTQNKIASTSAVIALGIRQMEMAESQSAIEELLRNKSISDTWTYVNSLYSVQGKVKTRLEDMQQLRLILSAKRDQALGEKSKLESYQKTLSDQQKVVASTKAAKNKLLADTQNKEANYKALLAQKIKEEQESEKELYNYEAQLKIAIDTTDLPTAQHGILSWPLDSVQVTQYFGKTVSAKRLYVSGTHNGIDLRASIGTPVKAVLSGVISDVEAYKSRSGCQYGKYVLIKHPNGLSTIYGHLSQVSVQPGAAVVTGDVIGYSGDTGYATGPHLHLGLYVTQGIRTVDAGTLGSTRCAGIKTVAAPPDAYLDPMAYLPTL